MSTLTKEIQVEMTPQQALENLKTGHQRFIEDRQEKRDLAQQVIETSTGQFPFAVVLEVSTPCPPGASF